MWIASKSIPLDSQMRRAKNMEVFGLMGFLSTSNVILLIRESKQKTITTQIAPFVSNYHFQVVNK